MRHLSVATVIAALGLTASSVSAQSTAYFTNFTGGDWNTAANWDVDFLGINAVPAAGTNADLATFAPPNVTYNSPMAAPSFGTLNLGFGSTLDVNAAGFNSDAGGAAVPMMTLSGILNVNSGGELLAANGDGVTIEADGALNVSGNALLAPNSGAIPITVNGGATVNVTDGGTLTVTNAGPVTLAINGVLNISNNAVMLLTNNIGPAGLHVGPNNRNNGALVTIDGATLRLDQPLSIRGGQPSGNLTASRVLMNGGLLDSPAGTQILNGQDDATTRLVVDGGAVANLGAFVVQRTHSLGGLVLSNGTVNATSMTIGSGIAAAFSTVYGGVLTNTGDFIIGDRTNAATSSDRRTRFFIRGGSVVSTSPDGIVLANQSNFPETMAGAGTIGAILDINAGTLTAEKITLVRDNTLTNAHATFILSGSGEVYLGSGGMIGNSNPVNATHAVNLNGGTLAAKDTYTIAANLTLGGSGATIKAADIGNAPFNITVDGIVGGGASLTKTGGGMLTLNAANTYSGNTLINEGTLAVGAAGSLANSPLITIASGATFDVSAAGYNLPSGQSLAGSGTVSGLLTAQSGSNLRPGTSAGTLTFAGGLTQAGGVVNHFELSDDPTGTTKANDLIIVQGDLDVSGGVNTILVSALDASIPAATYTLFQFTGNLIGDASNFEVTGVSGTIQIDNVAGTVSLTTSAVRGPADVTWVGNAVNNVWDVLNTANWLNEGTMAADFFVPGDDARFDDSGAANSLVEITEIVQPGSVVVDSTADYTFTGSGRIDGSGGLTKTNSGTLTVETANTYSGPTVIGGGTLEVALLDLAGVASGIGAAGTSAGNLVFDGGTLRYTGPNVTVDRNATLNDGGGVIDVAASGTRLTQSGSYEGSGALTKTGAGELDLTAASTHSGGTILEEGSLRISNGAAAATNLTLAGGVLSLQVDLSSATPVEIAGDSQISIGANRVIHGAVTGSGTLTMVDGALPSGRVFTLNGNLSEFAGGFAMGDNAGLFRFNSGGGNPATGSSNAVFDLGGGSVALVNRNGGGVTYHLGALVGGPNTMLRGSENTGQSSTYSIGGRNLDTTFAGTIQTGNGGAGAVVNLVKVGTGTLRLTGDSTYDGTTVIDEGTLQVDGSLGTTTVNVGQNTSMGTLAGSGTIAGPVDVAFGATLSPGSSIGQLTITNSLNLQFGSTNIFELDAAAGTNDSVVGLSFVQYGGLLIVTNLGGTLAGGQTYKLFDSPDGQYFGSFFEIILPPLTGDRTWETNNLAVDGTISVIGTGIPTITSTTVENGNLVISGSGGPTGGGAEYIVLGTTNVALPVTSWTPVVTNQFNVDGTFGFTNAIPPGDPKRFFLIEQQ